MPLLPASSLTRAAFAPPGKKAVTPFSRCGADDRFHDYILGEYEPLNEPTGKLRSLNLLVESFAALGVEDLGLALLTRVRSYLGPYRTVWGIKQTPAEGILGWEFYFYDFERRHADLTISRLCEALGPALHVNVEESRPLPWHMWSIEFSPVHLRGAAPALVDVYIDMRSYKVRGKAFSFENVYTFHDPRTEIEAILHRLRSSVHFNEKRDNLGALMPPSLFRCGRICVANKRSADALYFSRVKTASAKEFVTAQKYPPSIIQFFEAHEADLSHLLWDVGIDFCGDDGPLHITKTSIYGTF